MIEKRVLLMRGRFSNYGEYVKLVRGVVSHLVDNNVFMVCSYSSTDRERQDILVCDVSFYRFSDHGNISGGPVSNDGEVYPLREASLMGEDPSLIVVADFFDHSNDAVMDYIDTEIGLKYTMLLYYDKKNRPLMRRDNNRNIKLLNRFLKVEEMNRIHRRSCLIMKKGQTEGG